MNQRLWGIGLATCVVYAPLLYIGELSLSSLSLLLSAVVVTFFVGLTHYRIFKIHLLITAFLVSVYVHLSLHWGFDQLQSRFEAMIESPFYETKEYLRTHWWSSDTLMIVYFLCIVVVLWWGKKGEEFVLRFQRTIFVVTLTFALAVWTLHPLPPYQMIDEMIKANERLTTINSRFVDDKQKVNLQTNETTIEYDKIVIIIGESASRKHMSLYGYNRETTPFLSSLAPLKFDAIAPINQTRYAVPMELTAATVEHYEKFFNSPSLVTIFKHQGYHTYWISNQGKTGFHDSSVSSIAKEADKKLFLNDSYIKATLDTNLLESLAKVYTQSTHKKEVYFIHLIGSHDNYDRRYTKEMAKFGDQNIIDQYDNTIYFTDYVISKIYTLFKPTKKLLVVYFSDHGELVTPRKSGHGFNPAYQAEYEAPLMFYSSIENHNLYTLYQEYHQKVINLESVDDIIKGVVGINHDFRNISTSSNVSVLTPEKRTRFELLKQKD